MSPRPPAEFANRIHCYSPPVHPSFGSPIVALSRYVDAPVSMRNAIGMSNENIFGGMPDPVGRTWASGCRSIATIQSIAFTVRSLFFSAFVIAMLPIQFWLTGLSHLAREMPEFILPSPAPRYRPLPAESRPYLRAGIGL